MKNLLKFLTLLVLAIAGSCTGRHLITDPEYLKSTVRAFNDRRILAINRDNALFSVFDERMSVEQKEALEFLFAYMPLSDLADYDGAFFRANTNMALRARQMVPWGKDIPSEIFLHYVLPPRVNNENLDSFRIVYFNEIHNRIKNLDIKSAALEINQWCQEKVTYQPSDTRTSAPMGTILSARGRCGEESTFTVAALRTAGIPARQVYTPRWAHNDDNHAWVEIWSDGEWYYMGACEPEPVLDRGWFTEPARRAMLIHTRSYGAATGNENAIGSHTLYTEVNNLSKYAATKKLIVKVLNKNGDPARNAVVEYCLYNYAEFYPLASLPVSNEGISSIVTGFGDLLVWAYEGDEFAFFRMPAESTDTLTLSLSDSPGRNIELDLTVPPSLPPLAGPSQDLVTKNSERVTAGNSIRMAYIESWPRHEESIRIALSLGIDSSRTAAVFSMSMGNYAEIKKLLTSVPDSLRNTALSLLEILPEKDLRDLKASVIADHLLNNEDQNNLAQHSYDSFFLEYVLNPRIGNEMLTGWRSYLRKALHISPENSQLIDPETIIRYLNDNIKISDEDNFYRVPLTPKGVVELKVSDTRSRAIAFVAICRSFGIPSRLEPARNVPQYFLSDLWRDVYFKGESAPSGKKAYIRFFTDDKVPVPEYYIHFTIARFENGRYRTLEYEFNKKITGFGELEVLPGEYMLVTGNRLADSRILTSISFFHLESDEHREVKVEVRKDTKEGRMQGKIEVDLIAALFGDAEKVARDARENGFAVAWIEPGMEPSKHVLNDLPLVKKELDEWGGQFLFLSVSEQSGSSFKPGSFAGMPRKSLFSSDLQMDRLKKSLNGYPLSEIRIPFIIIADRNGNIVFSSSGYKTGIGEQIVKYLE